MGTLNDEVAAVDKPSVYLDSQGVPYYRMSSIGMCTKALIALRQGYTPTSPPASMQRRYDDGHLHEPDILRRLESEHGWDLWGHQDEVVVRIGEMARLIGHIDARGMHPTATAGGPAVIDAKTASKDAFPVWESIETGDDLRARFPYYWWQMGSYLAAEEHLGWDFGGFAVKNKNDGRMLVKVLARDQFPTLGDLVLRIMEIERGAMDELPVSCDHPSFPCPVWYLHEDSAPVGVGDVLSPEQIERIEALAVSLQQAKARKAAAEKVEDEAKAELLKVLGDVKSVTTNRFAKVTKYQGTSISFDKARLAEDHPEIDLDQYKKTSKYDAIRLTEREA